METTGENSVVTISFLWQDLVVPSIRKEPKTCFSKIKVVQILHTLLTTATVIFIHFFSKRVLKISQQLKALFG